MLRDVLRETWDYQDTSPNEHEEGPSPIRGYQQAFLQGMQQAHKEIMQELRQTLLKIVRLRFPNLVRLARKQIVNIEDMAILRDLIIKLSVAQHSEEAVMHLLELDEEDEDED